jgi:mannobiose 2-epimerase
MLHPANRLGYMQFTYDFQPLQRIIFSTPWGRDAAPVDAQAAPMDQTSPGHNVEFAWLLLHAADTLGVPRSSYADVVRRQFDHCIEFGIDPQFGGVYADVPMERPTTLTEKQFWQQAEVLVALLDAYALLGDAAYWAAFVDLQRFIFSRFVQMAAGGEWCERVARDGTPIDPALGHAWKSGYHTVRALIETVRRLRILHR